MLHRHQLIEALDRQLFESELTLNTIIFENLPHRQENAEWQPAVSQLRRMMKDLSRCLNKLRCASASAWLSEYLGCRTRAQLLQEQLQNLKEGSFGRHGERLPWGRAVTSSAVSF